MNYKRSKNELSHIVKKISEYNFKREDLEIYEGAGTVTRLGYEQWAERCRSLLDTFFSKDGKNSGVIIFPDVEVTLHSQSFQAEIWTTVLTTLNDWCKNSRPKDATGLIIRNYDLEDHFRFRGITEDEIKNTLGRNNSKNIFSFLQNDKRFFVFNPSLKIILIIRLVELQKGELRLVKKEVDHCIDEVNLLCFLLRDELANTGVVVTGLIAHSGENAHSQSGCEDCDNIIFSLEIFKSIKAFEGFWKSSLVKKKMEKLANDVARNLMKKNKANVFQAVATKILGYLSHFQFVGPQKAVLPITEQDAKDNIKQAELLLNCYQMEIAYSNNKRIWLEGNYGTGKTVVALKKLELLLKASKDKEVIYYINFARKSPLDFVIKQRFEKDKNFRAIKGEYSLSDIIKHKILPKERELGTKNINLVVDEYSSQYLSAKEVESLIPILNEEKELKNSTILIAVQPIKINRFENNWENGMIRQFFETKQLDKLIKDAGIKVKVLENVMRTTVQIDKFAEITQRRLNNNSNRCVRQCHQKKSKETNFYSSFQSTSLESNLSLSKASDDFSNRDTRTLLFQPAKLIDHDELYHLVHTESIADEENYHETVTSYSYTCDSKIGHDINDVVPKIIQLAESAGLNEQVALIAAVLYKVILEKESSRIAVIHLEPEDPPLWLKSLFQLKSISQRLTVTMNVEEFLKDESENLVLVKNLNFLRGLEFPKVLLILNSNEHYLRQLVPEAITRCVKDLTILVRPLVHGNNPSGTVGDLAVEWEKIQDYKILRILKAEFCLEPSCNSKKVQQRFYCNDEISFGTCYRFHQNSELYKGFLQEIQLEKIGNVQPENKEKQKEAEAM